VGTHAFYNLLTRNLLGMSVVTIVATGAGLILVGAVGGWSLARQHRCLRIELQTEVPGTLYRTMVTPGARARAQWLALRTGGLKGWRRTRRLHQQSAELALKKMQRGRRPGEIEITQEIKRLRQEINALM
jgi:hypothetical protein